MGGPLKGPSRRLEDDPDLVEEIESMAAAGYPLWRMAGEINVPPSTIGRWIEAGRRLGPSAGGAYKIARKWDWRLRRDREQYALTGTTDRFHESEVMEERRRMMTRLLAAMRRHRCTMHAASRRIGLPKSMGYRWYELGGKFPQGPYHEFRAEVDQVRKEIAA